MIGIGLRAAGSAKGNFWLDSGLDYRRIASLTAVLQELRPDPSLMSSMKRSRASLCQNGER